MLVFDDGASKTKAQKGVAATVSVANRFALMKGGDLLLVQPGGNALKKGDDEFNEKVTEMSPANHRCHTAAIQVSKSSADFCYCCVDSGCFFLTTVLYILGRNLPSIQFRICL